MNQIIVDVGVTETRLGLLEEGELVELYIERKNNKRIVGNIYKGRVTNVLPGMQAAFVDIGLEKNSFLYVKDAIPPNMYHDDMQTAKNIAIKDVIKKGQEIIVQVVKEPMGSKGARVTTHITLPGRYLVLMPDIGYLGVSRRITNEEERERLRQEVEEIKPENMGIIVRTVAEGKTKEAFQDDIKFLLKLWQKIEKEKKLGFAPRVIYKDFDLINRSIRDIFNKEIDSFVINDQEEYKSTLELIELFSPSLKNRIKFFNEDIEIFQHYGLDTQLQKVSARKVWLKSGGYIVIDATEALTVIDVNTGKYVGNTDLEETVFSTNIEAVQEIAKQLRLRDIGGIIVVDFIDMTKEAYIQQVMETLEQSLYKDRTRTKILGMTQLGLVEITRKKAKESLNTLLHKSCPCCEGTGSVFSEDEMLYKIEKETKRISLHTNSEVVVYGVNPSIYEKIIESRLIVNEIEEKYGMEIKLQPQEKLHYNDLKIKFMGKVSALGNEFKK